MINLADYACSKHNAPSYADQDPSAISLKLQTDTRRLSTFLDQEERFMPNNYQTTKQVRNYEEERARILEVVYEVSVTFVYCFLILLV